MSSIGTTTKVFRRSTSIRSDRDTISDETPRNENESSCRILTLEAMLEEYPAFEEGVEETYPPDEAERQVMKHVLEGVTKEYATRNIPAMFNSLFLCRFVREEGPDLGSTARAQLVSSTVQGYSSKEYVAEMAEWKSHSLHRVLETLAWSERVGYATLFHDDHPLLTRAKISKYHAAFHWTEHGSDRAGRNPNPKPNPKLNLNPKLNPNPNHNSNPNRNPLILTLTRP
jgi:hypothetical protein